MKKNTAGQVIGAQMVSAADGSAFTGAVTCYVCGDGGTQAAGSVGSGACTHEGNGYHTYAPAQAETNYDLIAFTFTGSGAVPATVQVFTSFPQTGDAYARLGAPAGASVSADIANVPTVPEFEARTLPSASYFDPAADTVKLDATQGAVEFGQVKIVADVANEGALDVRNTNADGYGQYNRGETYGQFNHGSGFSGTGARYEGGSMGTSGINFTPVRGAIGLAVSNLDAQLAAIPSTAAAAILANPANKLTTDASGRVEISGSKNTLDALWAAVLERFRLPQWRALTAAGALATRFDADSHGTAGTDFGAYVWCELADGTLLAGLGGLPAGDAGALVVSIGADGTVTTEQALDEDGIHELRLQDGKVYALGTDPSNGDDWSLGNVYVRSALGVWTKRRTLPNVLHSLSQCWVGSTWYVGTGAHTGDDTTWTGLVFKSADDGATWTALAAEVTDYRVYNLAYFRSLLYAGGMTQAQYAAHEANIYTSDDDGATWTDSGETIRARPRWVAFEGELVAVGSDGESLVVVGADGTIRTEALPFTLNIADYEYNVLADGANGMIFAAATDGLWFSRDLAHWRRLVVQSRPVSVGVWAAQGALVSSARGATAQAWQRGLALVDPANDGELELTAAYDAAKTAAQAGDAMTLDAAALTAIGARIIEGTHTHDDVLRLVLALMSKVSGGGDSPLVYRSSTDDKDRITQTVDEDGNRSAVTLDGTL